MTRYEIVAANPLPEFLTSRGYELRPAGKNFVTNGCPVEQHKKYHRCNTINTEKNLWHCNDCKRGGSVIDWLAIEKNITAGEAMRLLGGDRKNRPLVAATYDYVDESGKLLFQCVRFQPKDFKQRQPDGKGGWIWNLEGIRRVLYRLPEVIRAQTVCVVEGEKDADNLRELGFVATTNPMGAGKWRDEYSETLRGKDAVVFGDVGDEDGAGDRHTAQVIQALNGVAKSIAHVTLPNGFHDVSDYIASLPKESAAQTIRQLIEQSANKTPTQPSKDEETFTRLAGYSPAQYDRCRKEEAKRLGLRPATLDKEVEARRPKIETNAQGSAVEFPNIESWETPVSGAGVLTEVAATFSRYLVLPPGAADALALWTAHTHAFEAFTHTPRLNFCSPEKGCGKTTALDVTASLAPRALRAENITAAVLFRLVDSCKPILLLDEVDKYLPNAEELCGLLNAGHKRGAKAYRCEGENNTVRGFAAFAPAALAGIGALPGTLHDRSIVVRLVRAKPGEIAARFDSRRVQRETELCRKLTRWSADNFQTLKNCDPHLPETAFNRLADNWRPLFAIAEIAGGDWPKRATQAFTRLTSNEDLDAQGVGTLLLADIAAVFLAKNTDKVFSTQLCEELAVIEGRPWAEWGKHRKPISPNQLANQLRRFSLSPGEIRVGEKTGRGYELANFEDAFSRYLSDTPFSNRNSETFRGKTAISELKHVESMFHPENESLQRECFTVSLQKGEEKLRL